jgi:ribose transport system substrate-binding protein
MSWQILPHHLRECMNCFGQNPVVHMGYSRTPLFARRNALPKEMSGATLLLSFMRLKSRRHRPQFRVWPLFLLAAALTTLPGCRTASPEIAVIPRTSGVMPWEPEHGGALAAALSSGATIYWNAPTREDDVQGQVAMVDRVASSRYKGLILAPDHSLALITSVRRVLARGLPTVILGSPLAIPPNPHLGFVLNDEASAGRMAAERIATILHGRGQIVILGIDPDIRGIIERARIIERTLAQSYPNIRIVASRQGSFNVPHEQQVADETLRNYPNVDAIVALTSTSTHAALTAIDSRPGKPIAVFAFDPDSLAFENPALNCYIIQDTRRMGAEAVRLVMANLRGQPMPPPIRFQPILVTRSNANSTSVQSATSMQWRPAPMRWTWSVTP